MNRKSRIMERYARGGASDAGHGQYDWEYPKYLQDEYLSPEYTCSPIEFYYKVLDEIESCIIDKSKKDNSYKLWFGKYKGSLLTDITDLEYLDFLCNTQRKKQPKLVGQILLRIEEIQENNDKQI